MQGPPTPLSSSNDSEGLEGKENRLFLSEP